MKTTITKRLKLLAGLSLPLCLGLTACAQDYYSPPPAYGTYAAPPVVAADAQAPAVLSDEQLDDLLGPIALYPDPLLAQVLPASTFPVDIVMAARFVQDNPNPDDAAIDAQNWDPSVKAIAHYPDVLQMLSDKLDWTQTLGVAFINQQPDVMESIQRLRRQAQIAGSLETTPQQQVLVEDDYVRVMPADPQIIYVPVYDPQVVYVREPVYIRDVVVVDRRPRIWFGVSIRIGRWFDNDCDWHHRGIVTGGGWHEGWRHDDHGWQRDENWDRDHRDTRDSRGNFDSRGNRVDVRNTTVNNTVINKTVINNKTVVNNNTTINNITVSKPWTRDAAKPKPVMPAAVAAVASNPKFDDHRGFPSKTVGPAVDIHKPAALPVSAPNLALKHDKDVLVKPHVDPKPPVITPHVDPKPPVITPHVDPKPPVITPHVDPKPPVITPHVDPKPPVITPHVDPKPPVVTPPVITPKTGAFSGYSTKTDVQKSVDRAHDSAPAIKTVTPPKTITPPVIKPDVTPVRTSTVTPKSISATPTVHPDLVVKSSPTVTPAKSAGSDTLAGTGGKTSSTVTKGVDGAFKPAGTAADVNADSARGKASLKGGTH